MMKEFKSHEISNNEWGICFGLYQDDLLSSGKLLTDWVILLTHDVESGACIMSGDIGWITYIAMDCVVYSLAKVEFYMFVHALLQHSVLDSFQIFCGNVVELFG